MLRTRSASARSSGSASSRICLATARVPTSNAMKSCDTVLHLRSANVNRGMRPGAVESGGQLLRVKHILGDDATAALRQNAIDINGLARQQDHSATSGPKPAERSAPNLHGLGIAILRLNKAQNIGGAGA